MEFDDKFQKILSRLKANDESLTEIDLGGNQIGAAGAKEIAEALKTNTTLTELYLEDNEIHEAILESIDTLLERNERIATIKTSLLEGEKIVRMEGGQISIDGTTYDNNENEVELAIKSIAKDLEPNARDTESEKSSKDSIIDTLKSSSESSNIYLLVKIINSRDKSVQNIFSDTEQDIFIEEFVESDFIKPINAFLLSSKRLRQEYIEDVKEDAKTNTQTESSQVCCSLPPDTVKQVIFQLLPQRVQLMYNRKKANDQKAPEVQEDEKKVPEAKERKDIDEKEVAIEKFIKILFKRAAEPVKPNPMVSSAVAKGEEQGVGR